MHRYQVPTPCPRHALLPRRRVQPPCATRAISVLDRGFILRRRHLRSRSRLRRPALLLREHMARHRSQPRSPSCRSPTRFRGPLGAVARRWSRGLTALRGGNEARTPTSCLLSIDTRRAPCATTPCPAAIGPPCSSWSTAAAYIADAVRAKGVACVTADDFRWQKAHIKSTSLAGRRAVTADERRRGRHRDHHVPRRNGSARPRRATCGS
jgi:D-alanine transaminase